MPTYPELKLYVAGEWRSTADTIPVLNPANDSVIGALPVARTSDLDDALAAAEHGLKIWSRTAPRARAEIMLRASALLRERNEEVAFAITSELGKPIRQARQEVIRGCEFFEWDAGEAQRTYGHVIPSEPGIRYMTVHQPIGTVAAFSPWNFPMSQPARKIAGALAAGCSVILKAAEETPAGALHIARAFHDAGLPPGVLNLVFGVPSDISGYLIPHDQIRMIAFTGSTVVGRHLTGLASQHGKPVLMELGGHAPVIVCDDVDPHQAGILGATRKVRNAGQVCTSPTRFFVHENIFDRFVEAFAAQAAATVIADGIEESTEMGPVANARRVEALTALSEDAVTKGARLLTGGRRIGTRGQFFLPTVLVDVPENARVMQEEPFGPMAIINRVASLDEAITQANALPYGLAAYGMTHSAANVEEMLNRVEAGNLSINTLEASVAETPFGGVKASGFGREGGQSGLSHYTVIKTLSHRMAL
jgi:succinate-semialdehyde dehydrogenase / glutarate-semialdehyde dehydrogenase